MSESLSSLCWDNMLAYTKAGCNPGQLDYYWTNIYLSGGDSFFTYRGGFVDPIIMYKKGGYYPARSSQNDPSMLLCWGQFCQNKFIKDPQQRQQFIEKTNSWDYGLITGIATSSINDIVAVSRLQID